MKLVFIEAPAFARHRERYLDDPGFRRLQMTLLQQPDAGAVVPGTGGLRKLRWSDPRGGTGKRGGLRIWYRHLQDYGELWFFTLYDKGEVKDLTPREKVQLRDAVNAELSQRRRSR
ncbi:MAG: toxin [Gammaproteobacteria bacterium]